MRQRYTHSVRLLASAHFHFFSPCKRSSNREIQSDSCTHSQKHRGTDQQWGFCGDAMPKQSGCLSDARLIFQHNTVDTRPTCVSLLVFFCFSWTGGQVMSLARTEGNTETWIERIRVDWILCVCVGGVLNDAPIVQTVNTGVGRGSLAMPVGNYSIYARKMPRLWFMALPSGHGFLSPPLVAIQTSQHFTITAIVVERPR